MASELSEQEVWKRLTALKDLESVVEEFYDLLGIGREPKPINQGAPRHLKVTPKVNWD